MNLSTQKKIEILSLESNSFDSNIKLDLPKFPFPHTWTEYAHTDSHQIVERAKNATAILINKSVIDRPIIDKLTQLKIISITATGMNNVDLEYCREKGIIVTNVKDYGTSSIAEHVILLFLALKRKLYYYKKSIDLNKWSAPEQKTFCYYDQESSFPITELSGSRLGIIGAGTLGIEVGRLAHAFGMEVTFYNRSPISNKPNPPSYPYQQISLEQLFKESALISLHVPLNQHTKNLITLKEMKQMRPNTNLINTARGGIVNEQDLVIAIKEKIIAGTASDVMSVEPPTKANDPNYPNPLFEIAHLPNVILTPHIAWTGENASKNVFFLAVENIRKNVLDLIQKRANLQT